MFGLAQQTSGHDLYRVADGQLAEVLHLQATGGAVGDAVVGIGLIQLLDQVCSDLPAEIIVGG